MRDDPLTPYFAIAIAAAFGLAFALISMRHDGPTFEDRWSPVYQIDNGLKGDRLNPVAKPKSNKQVFPAGVRLASAECQSFCEFP